MYKGHPARLHAVFGPRLAHQEVQRLRHDGHLQQRADARDLLAYRQYGRKEVSKEIQETEEFEQDAQEAPAQHDEGDACEEAQRARDAVPAREERQRASPADGEAQTGEEERVANRNQPIIGSKQEV